MKRRTNAAGIRAAGLAAGLLLATSLALPGPLAAQQDDLGQGTTVGSPLAAHLAARPLVHAGRLRGQIRLDGSLDEPQWQEVAPATGFIQTDPYDGESATERTLIYILYDDNALYVGARLQAADGDVRTRLGRRDTFMWDSDWLTIALDTYHDHVSAVQFGINPAGVKRDEAIGTGNNDASWDAVWDAATSIDDDGWTAELRIPFSQLRFSRQPAQVWGIQISRRSVGREEVAVLAHTPKSERGGVARYGHMVGLEGIEPGRRLELVPYAVSRAEYLNPDPNHPFREDGEFFGGAGLDLKYRLTSSMTLDATVNPDFGQVEVDPAVINLSAFETSFNERRPFFVEGADIFRFSDLRLFYSRRIGRAPQGSLPDGTAYSDRPDNSTILGAARITGRTANGWNLGIVEALTAREQARYVDDNGVSGRMPVEPLTNHLAARATKLLRQGQTRVGGILTTVHRDLDSGPLQDLLRASAWTGGLDFVHEFANRAWTVHGYAAVSRVAGSEAALLRAQHSSARYFQRPDAGHVAIDSTLTVLGGYAARLAINKNAGLHWRGDANISAISPGFEINDLGFQTTADRIGADLNLAWVENTPGRIFRNYRINFRNAADWNFDGDRVQSRTSLGFNYQFLNYWGGELNLTHSFEALDDRLTRGGPLAHNLSDSRIEVQFSSDSRQRVSGRINFQYAWGESGGGTRQLSGSIGVRPSDHWSFSFGPRLNRTRTAAQYLGYVDDAGYTATFGRRYVFAPIDQTTFSMETRLNLTATPNLSFELFAQPFIATGDYGAPMQLRAARTFEFDPWTDEVDADDFNTRSLRGNAVMRWEWRPGSTLFLVWQQRRSGSIEAGDFDFGRDARAIFDTRPANVFLIKLNYWLNL